MRISWRSSGVVAPHTPWSIIAANAYSRHSTFTSQLRQIRFASANANVFAMPRHVSAKNPRRTSSGWSRHEPYAMKLSSSSSFNHSCMMLYGEPTADGRWHRTLYVMVTLSKTAYPFAAAALETSLMITNPVAVGVN